LTSRISVINFITASSSSTSAQRLFSQHYHLDITYRFLLTRGIEGTASIDAAEAAAAAVAAAAEREILMKSAFPPLSSPLPSLASSSSPSSGVPALLHDYNFPSSSFLSSPSSPTTSASEAPDLSPDVLRSWASARLKDNMRYVFAQVCHRL
jgi:hypothetical protein